MKLEALARLEKGARHPARREAEQAAVLFQRTFDGGARRVQGTDKAQMVQRLHRPKPPKERSAARRSPDIRITNTRKSASNPTQGKSPKRASLPPGGRRLAVCWPLNWTLPRHADGFSFPLWLGYILVVDAGVAAHRDLACVVRRAIWRCCFWLRRRPGGSSRYSTGGTHNWEYLGHERLVTLNTTCFARFPFHGHAGRV